MVYSSKLGLSRAAAKWKWLACAALLLEAASSKLVLLVQKLFIAVAASAVMCRSELFLERSLRCFHSVVQSCWSHLNALWDFQSWVPATDFH
jgi:hypothetical protein